MKGTGISVTLYTFCAISSGESQSIYALIWKEPWNGVSIVKVSCPNIIYAVWYILSIHIYLIPISWSSSGNVANFCTPGCSFERSIT